MSNLTNVSLLSLSETNGYTFFNCKSIKTLYLSSLSVCNDGYDFAYCASLEEIYLNKILRINNGHTFTFPICESLTQMACLNWGICLLGCTKLVNLSLPSLTTVPSGCFENCSSIDFISFRDCTYREGDSHFSGCTNLRGNYM